MERLSTAKIASLLADAEASVQHFENSVERLRLLFSKANRATLEATQALESTDLKDLAAIRSAITALKAATDVQTKRCVDLMIAAQDLEISKEEVDDLKKEIATRTTVAAAQ